MTNKRKLYKISKEGRPDTTANADMFDINPNGYAVFVHAKDGGGGEIILSLAPSEWDAIYQVDRDTLIPAYQSAGTIIH